MIYLKSAVAGIAAVFALAILTVFAMGIYVWIAFHPAGNGVAQWDPISLTKPLTWFVIIGVFLIGFFWEFRRVASK
jgi:hypothetical protein